MTIEIRVTHDDDSYEQYAVAREPVADPEAWTTVSWDNGNPEPFTIQVHPEEVFTGEQAVPVFRAYIEEGALQRTELLRRIDVEPPATTTGPAPTQCGATVLLRRRQPHEDPV